MVVTSVFADPRPQSLPPASMVPSVPPVPHAVLATSSPIVLPITGEKKNYVNSGLCGLLEVQKCIKSVFFNEIDLSRPSSTPVYGNFSSRSNLGVVTPNPPPTNVYGQGMNCFIFLIFTSLFLIRE